MQYLVELSFDKASRTEVLTVNENKYTLPLGGILLFVAQTSAKKFNASANQIAAFLNISEVDNLVDYITAIDNVKAPYKEEWFQNLLVMLPIVREYQNRCDEYETSIPSMRKLNQIYNQLLDEGSNLTAKSPEVLEVINNGRELGGPTLGNAFWLALLARKHPMDDFFDLEKPLVNIAKDHLKRIYRFFRSVLNIKDELSEYLLSDEYRDEMTTSPKIIASEWATNTAQHQLTSISTQRKTVLCTSFGDIALHEYIQLQKATTPIRKCKLCGNYFIAPNRKHRYCDMPNADHDFRPCCEIGAKTVYSEKIHSDPVLQEYSLAANTYNGYFHDIIDEMNLHRFDDDEVDYQKICREARTIYSAWCDQTEEAKAKYEQGLISAEEAKVLFKLPSPAERAPMYAKYLEYKKSAR